MTFGISKREPKTPKPTAAQAFLSALTPAIERGARAFTRIEPMTLPDFSDVVPAAGAYSRLMGSHWAVGQGGPTFTSRVQRDHATDWAVIQAMFLDSFYGESRLCAHAAAQWESSVTATAAMYESLDATNIPATMRQTFEGHGNNAGTSDFFVPGTSPKALTMLNISFRAPTYFYDTRVRYQGINTIREAHTRLHKHPTNGYFERWLRDSVERRMNSRIVLIYVQRLFDSGMSARFMFQTFPRLRNGLLALLAASDPYGVEAHGVLMEALCRPVPGDMSSLATQPALARMAYWFAPEHPASYSADPGGYVGTFHNRFMPMLLKMILSLNAESEAVDGMNKGRPEALARVVAGAHAHRLLNTVLV